MFVYMQTLLKTVHITSITIEEFIKAMIYKDNEDVRYLGGFKGDLKWIWI